MAVFLIRYYPLLIKKKRIRKRPLTIQTKRVLSLQTASHSTMHQNMIRQLLTLLAQETDTVLFHHLQTLFYLFCLKVFALRNHLKELCYWLQKPSPIFQQPNWDKPGVINVIYWFDRKTKRYIKSTNQKGEAHPTYTRCIQEEPPRQKRTSTEYKNN